MKIPGYYNSQISKAHLQKSQVTQRKKPKPESGKLKKDEMVLSPRATEVREFEELSKTIPEVRHEKIGAVKKQVQSKTYTVDGKAVARSIIDLLG